MSQPLAAALARLIEGRCRASAFTPAQRKALQEFARRTGALAVVGDGRGNRYEIRHPELIHAHLRNLRPQDAESIDPSLPRRAANIAYARDSKSRAHGHAWRYLLAKGVGEGVVWRKPLETGESAGQIREHGGHGETQRTRREAVDDSNSPPLNGSPPFEAEIPLRDLRAPPCSPCSVYDLSSATAIAGVGALAITEEDHWHTHQPLWLVENQALFDRADWLPPGTTATLAYYAGELPEWLLRWLALRPRASEVILFPDYDGVGLLNYARLRRACAAPCGFWLMPGWRERLAAYGSNILWLNTLGEFQTAVEWLGSRGPDGPLADLIREMAGQGLALEQEAVWIERDDR